MDNANEITITSTHTSTSAANTYNHTHRKFLPFYKLILNPDKTNCTLFTPDPAEYMSNLDLKIHNNALPMATHPKILGLTLDPKLTYSTAHTSTTSQYTHHKPLQINHKRTYCNRMGYIGKQETLMATYKAVMRPALEYASCILYQH